MITITTATIDNAYNEVTTWRKNTFLVPYGKTGRNFIDQLTKHILVPHIILSVYPIIRLSTCQHRFYWGRNCNGGMITITTATIADVYNEVKTWRKNTFLVPYGKTGRDFIDQFTKHIEDWNNRSPVQHLALKAAIVLLAVALQKPGQRSKAKERQECLEKRLTLWRNGEIESLLLEERMIQRCLSKSNKNDPPNCKAGHGGPD